ncbi:MAG: hypothetical protein HY319_21305 [Armatimonadetes bacterium]|nr:hypothetical protein [Armatimonadota bacterium]
MASLLERYPEAAGLVVWLPMLATDDEHAAARMTSPAWQIWDGQLETARAFRRTLGLGRQAWDVYLLYPAGVRWEAGDPPVPPVWMHQLQGEDPTRCLDEERLDAQIRKLLEPSRGCPAP